MLLIVAHPTIGAALATLLGMEDRYEVLRVHSLELAEAALRRWKPHAALVDGLLLQSGPAPRVSVPAFVLSGSAVEGQGLARRLPDARGWLRKDATAVELRAAIDSVVASSDARSRRAVVTVTAVTVPLLAIAALVAWALLGTR